MYAIVVSNTTISPVYFLDEMTEFELDAVIEQYNENQKVSWEQTRLLATYFVNCFSSKVIQPKDLIPFKWDKQNPVKKVERPVIDYEKIRKMEEILNRKTNG